MCIIFPYYHKKSNIIFFVYYENQRTTCETNNVRWSTNSKSKDLVILFRFLNIHISHKTQLAMTPLGLYIKKCKFEHNLTWFLACFWQFYPNIFIYLISIVECAIFFNHLKVCKIMGMMGD